MSRSEFLRRLAVTVRDLRDLTCAYGGENAEGELLRASLDNCTRAYLSLDRSTIHRSTIDPPCAPENMRAGES